MTHLRIELNTITENVTSDVIHKLYETAKAIIDAEEANDVQESLVSLKGNLLVSKAYGDEVDWLETKFPDLYITAGTRYVRFEDPEVQRVLLSNGVGDGIGIDQLTLTQTTYIGSLNKASTFNSDTITGAITDGVFLDNTSIVSFNELKRFTLITKLDYQAFRNCSNLTSIDLTNIVSVSTQGGLGYCGVFQNCSSLTKLYLPNLLYLSFSNRDGYSTFGGCTSLVSIDCPSLISTNIYTNNSLNGVAVTGGSFYNMPQLLYINFGHINGNFNLGNLWNSGTFTNCALLKVIDFGDNVVTLGDWMIQGCPNILAVVLRNNNVVTVANNKGTASVANLFGNSNVQIYVPDSLISAYLGDNYWSNLSSNIVPLSTYSKSDYISDDI